MEGERTIPRYVGAETAGRSDKMSKEEIRERFDKETASVYSQRDPAWLPEFQFAFGLVPALVKRYTAPGARVLDIGAGTGNLSRTVLQAVEGINVTLMDFSQNMLAEVPNVLRDFSGRFDVVCADFMEADLGRKTYRAVVSSFAIHHCRGQKSYQSLYRRIARALERPGVFVCADVVAGDSGLLSEQNEAGWMDFLRAQGFGEPEARKILSNYHVEDSPISLRAHMSLLIKAGFTTADVLWKKHNFGVYAGIME